MSKTPYRIIKRILDIIISFTLLVLLFPLLLIIAFLIRISGKGEIFVRDPLRLGLGEEEFKMYKFRTMIPNAHSEIMNNPEYGELKEQWETNGNKLKIDEDTRIIKIGRFLRRTDFDELPQLMNVLKGEMSLVGPRPMYREEVLKHLIKNPDDERYLVDIFSVMPGITGIWQVSGRNKIPLSERLRMDAAYARNLNFRNDLDIFLKTPSVVLTRRGAYE